MSVDEISVREGSADESTSMAASRRPRAISPRFLLSELQLIFGRRRNQVGLLGLAAVPILIAVAVRLSDDGGGGPIFGRITQNGLFVALAALTVVLPLFLPLATAIVSGDSIAGEAGSGTVRYLLTVPVDRTRMVVVKYAALALFSLACALLIGLVGAAIGLALFGTGPVVLLSGTTIGTAEAFGRIILVALYVGLNMCGLAAVGLFLSTLTEYAVAAMAGTAMFAVVSQVLSVIPQLDWLRPYLPSSYWLSFDDLLRDPMVFSGPLRGLLYSAILVAVFGTAAWARFSTKDVSS